MRLVYAVVSAENEKAVETFIRREDAERFLERVSADDPELAASCVSSRSSSTPRRLRHLGRSDARAVGARFSSFHRPGVLLSLQPVGLVERRGRRLGRCVRPEPGVVAADLGSVGL